MSLDEVAVEPIQLSEFLVLALLHINTITVDKDDISVLDCGEPVRDGDGCAPLACLVDGCLRNPLSVSSADVALLKKSI